MKTRNLFLTLVALAICLSLTSSVHAAPVPPAKGQDIDVVICLDVSGSMNGLINSARAKLWDIVNDLGKVKPTPNLRVGLYSYGHTSYDKNNGWVRKEVDLTDDLDTVYQKLNALKLNGGNEYVTRVAKNAIVEQKWASTKNALRMIYVCGNEPGNQDKSTPVKEVTQLAIKKDIIINTIYCQSRSYRIDAAWKQLAQLAEGDCLVIDQDKGTVVVNTPFDAELNKLSGKLNTTYLACGTAELRQLKKEQQVEQDRNANRAGRGVGAARAATKAGGLYRNARWDLVDQYKLDPKKFDVTKIKTEHLPKEMQKMTNKEKLAHVKKMLDERNVLQKQIQELAKKRADYVAKERKKLNLDNDQAFDTAVRKALRKQAAKKGLEIPK